MRCTYAKCGPNPRVRRIFRLPCVAGTGTVVPSKSVRVLLLQRAECTLPVCVGHPGPGGNDRFREQHDGIRMSEGFTLYESLLLVEHQRGARYKGRSPKVRVDCCNMRVHGRRNPSDMRDDKRREQNTHCVPWPEPAV